VIDLLRGFILEPSYKTEPLLTAIQGHLIEIDKLTIPEIELIFRLVIGDRTPSLQAGSLALLPNKQRVVIVGFSKDM